VDSGVTRSPSWSADRHPGGLDAAMAEVWVRLTVIVGRTQQLRRRMETDRTIDPDIGVEALLGIESQLWAMEAALRASESRFRAIVEEASDYAILTTDAEGRIDGWYPGAEAVFGWTPEEALGQSFAMTFTPEDRESGAWLGELERARETGYALDVRWHVHKDGTRVFIDGSAYALREPGGEFRGLLKIGQDVTARRAAEMALRESETRLQERVTAATAELRALSRRLLAVQEEERRHLARELHDEIGQMLTGLGFQLGAAAPEEAPGLADARRTVQELTEQVRQMSMDLRPSALDAYGLLAAARWHIDRYQTRTGVRVDFRYEGLDRRFQPVVEVAAYRVLQEALTNVARHGGTEAASVSMLADGTMLTVAIRDSGRGFDPAIAWSASGLSGMQERVELLGGTLTVDTAPGAGTLIAAELPLEAFADTMDAGVDS
jgi:PAS domain S-box-containing protein